MSEVRFNLFSPEVRDDPYPHYAELRKRAPVCRIEGTAFWAVSRYEDTLFVLKNPEIFSSLAMRTMMMGGMGIGMRLGPDGQTALDAASVQQAMKLFETLPFDVMELLTSRSLISTDPPDHAPLRNIVNRGFTPRRIAALEPRIREITRDAIDGMLPKGETDLVADLTIPLPVSVISELLGVEPERRQDFKRWSNAVTAGMTGSAAGTQPEWLIDAFRDMTLYFADVIEKRRRDPKDDLISAILRAEEGEAALSPIEVLMFTLLLLVAGNETTTNLVGNAVVALLAHPGEFEKVRADLTLIPSLVEEAIRYDAPVQALFRHTTREVELAGTTLPAGAIVMPLFASANRDESQFPDADRFDVTRNPQGHLAFGFGIHFCLGASLARLEARVALEAIVTSLTNLRHREERGAYVDAFLLRGPRRLPLAFDVPS